MSIAEHDTDTAARAAADWLDAFEFALRRRPDRLGDLFVEDSHWRDILAFTWDLRTFSGRDRIAGELATATQDTGATDLRWTRRTPPRVVTRLDVETVEVIFDFDTAHGTGSGVVRLVRDDAGTDGEDLKAWTLLTTLHDLREFEERVGPRRPKGESYSRNFGGENWLDHRRRARSYRDADPEVVIVGAGQAGLALAARLGQRAVDTLVVDREERVGDNWRNRYHSLTLHNEVWVNHLPYLPFPPTWPVYVPKDKLANWLEAYVESLELNVWTSSELVSGEYDEDAGRWTAVLDVQGERRTMRPAHIVMATGVSGIPRYPDIPGLGSFGGTVMHSSEYTDGAGFSGRRAMVVGTGNSGHDVAQDLYAQGAEVTLVQRSPTTVVSIEPSASLVYAVYSEGLPTDEADLLNASMTYPLLVRSYQALTRRWRDLDAELVEGLEGAGFRTDYGADETGFQMKYLRRGGGYYLNVGCSDLIIENEIGLIQNDDVERVTPEGVRLRDGRTLPADVLVLATGYHSLQESVRRFFGDAVADRVGPVWGFDEHGELANMWKRTGQPGLWFTAGSLAQCRIYSTYLAIQIKACQEGLLSPEAPPRG